MDIQCDQCKSKFKIADDKLPEGKVVTLKCPKCKNKISVGNVPEMDLSDSLPEDLSFDEGDSDTYDSSEKPFDFVEEEGKTALVCESEKEIREKILEVLDLMEYHVTVAEGAREALKSMRYHNYDLIVVNEEFDNRNPDANGLLIYLERLNMQVRRNIIVALMTKRFRTMDHMTAYHKSVNMIINTRNIHDFDKIISRGIADSDLFYRVYREIQKKVGLV